MESLTPKIVGIQVIVWVESVAELSVSGVLSDLQNYV